MAHEFDVHGFERFLADVERLIAETRAHEDRIASVIGPVEHGAVRQSAHSESATAGPGSNSALNSTEFRSGTELLSSLRDIHREAREQRQLAESILTRLIGDITRTDGKRTVLVVDDTTDSRDLAADVIEASGFHAITASNGLEAIIVAHYARPAVVLMDITMPVLNGFEAARILRASVVTQHMHVIAYTANRDFSDGPFAQYFVHVLTKPTTPEAITTAVRQFIATDR